MWNWLKNLFTPKKQEVIEPHIELYQEVISVQELQQLTKGDRKKLKAQGKIKSIEYPFY